MKIMSSKGKILTALLSAVLIVAVLGALTYFGIKKYLTENKEIIYARGHGYVSTSPIENYAESNKELDNPARGFYSMYAVTVTDAPMDKTVIFSDKFAENTGLKLIELNLNNYTFGEIRQPGLENIERIFERLEELNSPCIVRFLYDWDGKNMEIEPASIDIILRHMKQIAPIMNEHKNAVFSTQGLFVGSWGEMHSTRYGSEEDFRLLAETLDEALDSDIYMAVRTPAQWRTIIGTKEPEYSGEAEGKLSLRLGLFNDGMFGGEFDLGTYGNVDKNQSKALTDRWNRAEELDFQDVLCKRAPNGGETVGDNEYNDIDNVLGDMQLMHLTYLHKNYDTSVIEKWKNQRISDGTIFDGFTGYDYISEHLGYRLVLSAAAFSYNEEADTADFSAGIRNVGFAPIYMQADTEIVLKGNGIKESIPVERDIRELTGGKMHDTVEDYGIELELFGMPEGTYELYFNVKDIATGRMLEFANEEEMTEDGYYLGSIELGGVEEYWQDWKEAKHLGWITGI